MKKRYFLALALIGLNEFAFGQTPLTVDANDVLNSNSKIVIYTGVGQSFFNGHQAGGGYAYPYGIFRAMTDNAEGSANYFYEGVTYDGIGSFLTNYSVRADGQGFFAGGINIGGSPLIQRQASDAKLDIFGANANSTNLILSANYNNIYRWRFNTIDRGNAIDMDITASDNFDTQHSILKLSPEFSGRPSLILMNNWLVANNGNIGIGTTDNANWQLATSPYKLAVGGNVIAEQVTVKLQNTWPDYVFKPAYRLISLSELKAYIDKNQHLPDMPSAEQVEKNGQNLGEMNKLLTKKVEELTLYLIDLKKENEEIKKQLLEIQSRQNK